MKYVVIIVLVVASLWIIQRMQANKKAAAENLSQGQEFLAKNMTREGVVTTETGLQYLILKPGQSEQQPSLHDKVRVHYEGKLIDGSIFDSSIARGKPISFRLDQVIPGWTEGLQMMHIGEKRRLFIPADLGYGSRAAGSIPPNSVLIFDVELLGIND